MSTTYYLSSRNAMKRDESSGTTSMSAPVTSAYGGTLYVRTLTVSHNLGYIPVFRYFYEPFGDGTIWPPLADRNDGRVQNPLNITKYGPGITGWADSTNIYLQLFYTDNTLTGTYPVYWVVYKDFKL